MEEVRTIRQREIYICSFQDSVGSEMKGNHTALVVSVDIRNDYSPNVYVFPITHARKKYQPTHWKLYQDKYDFLQYKTNTVLCEDGCSVSKLRLNRRLGEIDEIDFEEILKCKDYIFKKKELTTPL